MQYGPYILDERVGRGAMAEVWSGWHAGRSDRQAIKIVTRLAGRDESELDAFFHEVRTVASLSHPGIVQILDYGQAHFEPVDAMVPYLVTELARGGTLGTGWRAGTFGDVRRALLAILDALAHAHARGVIHRDLKPGNVLRMTAEPDAPLKVTDFGIARLAPMGERSFADGLIAGTPRYMAPEQILGAWRDHGPWTDLYAVGCIAWTLVTGRPPFEGDREEVYRRHLEEEPPPLVPIVAIPDAMRDWLHWLLRKDIALRCDRAADAAMELLGLSLPDDPHTIEVSLALDDPPTSTLISDDLVVSSLDRPPPERVQKLRRLASANRALTDATMPNELRLWGLRRVPFVGRRAERRRLWASLQRAFESSTPQLVIVEGPAGTGKSALARWLAERSHELGLADPMLVLHDPISRRSDGLRGTLIRAFRLEDLDVAEAVARLRTSLARRIDDAEALAHAGVLGDWVVTHDPESASRFELEERAQAVLAMLRAFGRPRVPLVWIEDADRAAATLRTLTRAIELAGDRPLRLMIIATPGDSLQADDELTALARVCETVRLPLPPLSDEETAELLDAMLPLAPSFRDSLLTRATGNALVAVQMLGALIAHSELALNTDGEFELRDTAMPTSNFAALLEMRIGSLAQELSSEPDDLRQQLEVAAALGRTVRPIEWLIASGKRGLPIGRDLLDALVRSGLAVPSGELWAFAHDLVRDELVAGAQRHQRWTVINALCADALDDLYARPDPERRANHLLEARAWSLAIDACIAAAEAALREKSSPRARRWLDRADLALTSGELPDDIRRQAVASLRARL